MAHQMTLMLSDREYEALRREAARSGQRPETFLHEMIQQLQTPPAPTNRPMTGQEFMEQQYREGKVLNIPTRRRLTQEEKAERERLAKLFSGGKSASDMVIEDRGPY